MSVYHYVLYPRCCFNYQKCEHLGKYVIQRGRYVSCVVTNNDAQGQTKVSSPNCGDEHLAFDKTCEHLRVNKEISTNQN